MLFLAHESVKPDVTAALKEARETSGVSYITWLAVSRFF
jgi:hypothetical protein